MTSTLDRVDGLRDRVAELWVEGVTNKALAETVHSEFADIEDVPCKTTVINWRKDEAVENKIHSLMRARIGRIVRRIDAVIAAKIDNADDLTVDEALKIRKEFVPERDAFTDEKQDAAKIDEDLFGAMADDPEFAKRVAAMANAAE